MEEIFLAILIVIVSFFMGFVIRGSGSDIISDADANVQFIKDAGTTRVNLVSKQVGGSIEIYQLTVRGKPMFGVCQQNNEAKVVCTLYTQSPTPTPEPQ